MGIADARIGEQLLRRRPRTAECQIVNGGWRYKERGHRPSLAVPVSSECVRDERESVHIEVERARSMPSPPGPSYHGTRYGSRGSREVALDDAVIA